jgi:hypothetical protein
MPQNISFGTSFNPSSIFVPGVYLQVVPPTAFFGGAPTSIFAVNGTASWGKANSPQLIGSPQQLVATFGGVAAAALTDPHDIATDITIALGQANGNAGNGGYGNRVTDGTDTQAGVSITDTSGATILTLLASQTGILGRQIAAQFAAGGPGPDQTITLTGSLTTGDVVNILFINANLQNGSYTLSYTVTSGDTTLTLLATHIAAAINASGPLASPAFTATSNAAVVTISWPQKLQSVNISTSVNGSTVATIGGTATPTDIVTINVLDVGLSGGTLAIPYTVQMSDTLTLIATGLKTLINASAPLIALGITATSAAAVLTLKSTSPNQTTFTRTLSVGALETVTFTGGPTEIATGARIASVTMNIVPFPGAGSVETYTGLSGTASRFPGAALTALNNGLNVARPASAFADGITATPTALPPLLGQYVMTGGSDGRNVTTAQLVGNAAAVPPTGIYALESVQFTPSVMWLAGLTDSQAYATVQQFLDSQDIFGLFTFTEGLSTAAAVAAKFGYGIQDYQVGFVKDWQWWFDTANQQSRLVPPLAFAGGAIATLPPWASPSNTGIQLSQGTERNNPFTGNVPYTNAELSQLGQAGIMVITNGIPAGNIIGFRNGYNSVGNNDPTSFVEYSRMTNFIVQTNNTVLGQFIGKLTGFTASDGVRAQITAVIATFLQNLLTQGVIGGFNVQCNNVNNPQSQLAQHEVAIFEQITYLPSIVSIFTQVQGGTTVVTTPAATGA